MVYYRFLYQGNANFLEESQSSKDKQATMFIDPSQVQTGRRLKVS
jgi:hypothetical protein